MTQQINISGFQIDDFHLDVQNRQLKRDDEILPLNSKYFDVLVMLISNRGQLVEKSRIFDEIWDGVIVSDSSGPESTTSCLATTPGRRSEWIGTLATRCPRAR